MPEAAPSPNGYGREVPLRRRLASLALAVLINIAMLVMLLLMSPTLPGTKNGTGKLLTFNVNDQDKQGANRPKAQQATKAQTQQKQPKPVELPKPTIEPPVLPPRPSNFIELSRNDFAATDVSKIQSAAPSSAGSGQGEGQGQGDTELAGGSGPHGEPLYRAEWYREPTQAQLGPFLAKSNASPGDWAEIACRTVSRFHVEDCVILGESMAGIRLGRQIQDAAFQFLVRPPRVGGKTLVGSWVRIRITISGVRHEDR